MFRLALLILLLTVSVCIGQGTKGVTLQWDAPPVSTNLQTDFYKIYFGRTGTTEVNVQETTDTFSLVPNLLIDSSYYFYVTGANAIWESEASNVVEHDVIIRSTDVFLELRKTNDVVWVTFQVIGGFVYELQKSEDATTWTTTGNYLSPTNTWVAYRAFSAEGLKGPSIKKPMLFRILVSTPLPPEP